MTPLIPLTSSDFPYRPSWDTDIRRLFDLRYPGWNRKR